MIRRTVTLTLVFFLGMITGWNIHHHLPTSSETKGGTRGTFSQQLTQSVLWYQTAAEARASYYQAYNWARHQLEQYLKKDGTSKPPAVIVDVDETVLDNSPYEAWLIQAGKSYPEGWNEWVQMARARALPGAVEFLSFADQHQVNIFYVSNRHIQLLEPTLQNLKRQGFPQAEAQHVLLRNRSSSKEPRRQQIARQYDIVLLVGDNVSDFARTFEEKSVPERREGVDRFRKAWGSRFIVLPNPMYGEWEGAVYRYQWNLPLERKRELRLHALTPAPLPFP